MRSGGLMMLGVGSRRRSAAIEAEYWRAHFTGNEAAGNSIISFLEMQFHTGANGFGPKVVPTASLADSTFGSANPSAYLVGNLFNGSFIDLDPFTGVWASTDTAFPHWVRARFGGGPQAITGVSFVPRYVSSAAKEFSPTAFALQYSSDDSAFTQDAAFSGLSWDLGKTKYFQGSAASAYTGSPHGAHRRWRARAPRDNGGTIVSASEITFRATPGGAAIAGGTPISSGDTGGFVKGNAFDGNPATFWASTGTTNGTYIGLDFGAGNEKVVAGFTWRIRTDSDANQSPIIMLIEYDDGDDNWTVAFSAADLAAWAVGETRTVTDPHYVL